MTEDGVTKIMKLEGTQRMRKEEERGRRKLRGKRMRGESKERGEEWVKRMMFYFILTMGFGTTFPVSKMINIDQDDIEELRRNEACGWNTTGWRI